MIVSSAGGEDELELPAFALVVVDPLEQAPSAARVIVAARATGRLREVRGMPVVKLPDCDFVKLT